jgi:isopenicillin N synthase-like dioxygenase
MPAPTGEDVPFWLKLHEGARTLTVRYIIELILCAGPNQWPAEQDLPRFREQMNILFTRYHQLNLDLNKHICHLLSLPETGLDEYFPTPTPEFNSAIWHYFPVSQEIRDEAKNGFAQGMHEHRDPSTFVTCLIQSRPGLQVQTHRGVWLDVPHVAGGIVCNIGQLDFFTIDTRD